MHLVQWLQLNLALRGDQQAAKHLAPAHKPHSASATKVVRFYSSDVPTFTPGDNPIAANLFVIGCILDS